MLETMLPLVLLLALVAMWHSALGARERARMHAQHLCARAGLQLLDQSVALHRVRLEWPSGSGLRLTREYVFEVSHNGMDRNRGSLRMSGTDLQSWSLPTVAMDEPGG